jgi:hypothetical protein
VLSFTVPTSASKRLPGNAARSRSDAAASIRSNFSRANISNPENALTPFPSGEVSGPLIPIADDHVVPKVHEGRVTSGIDRHHTTNGPGQRLINVFAEGSLMASFASSPLSDQRHPSIAGSSGAPSQRRHMCPCCTSGATGSCWHRERANRKSGRT